MSTEAPSKPKYGSTRIGDEMGGNPLSWILARNKRMADQLDQIPTGASTLQKVLRGIDYYCKRHGLSDEAQRSRIHTDVIYVDATDSIVIQLKRS